MDSAADDLQNIDVGTRLHELRTERGLSMRSLSRLSGLSTNALSMIERSRTSPSVSTLYKIADALGVPITAFFRMEPAKQQIVFCKASERTRIPVPRGLFEGLGGESFTGGVEPLMITLERGANSGQFNMLHSGHEFVLCLEGQLEYEVENERYTLMPGDSLLFSARFVHRWRNPGTTPTRALIVLSGFVKGESPTEYHLTSGKTVEEG